jgi:hypothetical protein
VEGGLICDGGKHGNIQIWGKRESSIVFCGFRNVSWVNAAGLNTLSTRRDIVAVVLTGTLDGTLSGGRIDMPKQKGARKVSKADPTRRTDMCKEYKNQYPRQEAAYL